MRGVVVGVLALVLVGAEVRADEEFLKKADWTTDFKKAKTKAAGKTVIFSFFGKPG
jgi:hypothetical protein